MILYKLNEWLPLPNSPLMSVSCFAYVATQDELFRMGTSLGVNCGQSDPWRFATKTAEAIFDTLPGRVRLRIGRMNEDVPIFMYVLGRYNATLDDIHPALLASMENIFQRKPLHMPRDENRHWINGSDKIFVGESVK